MKKLILKLGCHPLKELTSIGASSAQFISTSLTIYPSSTHCLLAYILDELLMDWTIIMKVDISIKDIKKISSNHCHEETAVTSSPKYNGIISGTLSIGKCQRNTDSVTRECSEWHKFNLFSRSLLDVIAQDSVFLY